MDENLIDAMTREMEWLDKRLAEWTRMACDQHDRAKKLETEVRRLNAALRAVLPHAEREIGNVIASDYAPTVAEWKPETRAAHDALEQARRVLEGSPLDQNARSCPDCWGRPVTRVVPRTVQVTCGGCGGEGRVPKQEGGR